MLKRIRAWLGADVKWWDFNPMGPLLALGLVVVLFGGTTYELTIP